MKRWLAIAGLGLVAACGPLVQIGGNAKAPEALLTLRTRARDARDWPSADLIREQLTAAGVEVRDGADGSSWDLPDR